MVLYVACFGVSFCTVSPSVCLAECPPFGKELLNLFTICSLCYIFLSFGLFLI